MNANIKVRQRRLRDIAIEQRALLALLVLIIFACIKYPTFMTYTNITNVARQSSMLGVIAVGMTFVILTGGIDLSVGALTALCGVLMANFLNMPVLGGQNFVLAILLTVAIGTAMGFIGGFCVAKLNIAPFISSLAMMQMARGINYVITEAISVTIKDVPEAFSNIMSAYVLGIPLPVIIWIVFLVIAVFIARFTGFGRSVYSIGGSEEAAMLMGLHVVRTKILVYTISGFCCGIAGTMLTSRLGAGQAVACSGWEMNAIAATALGGTLLTGGQGKFYNTLFGVLIINIINNVINLQGNVNSWWVRIITGLILLAVVVLQSQIERAKKGAVQSA